MRSLPESRAGSIGAYPSLSAKFSERSSKDVRKPLLNVAISAWSSSNSLSATARRCWRSGGGKPLNINVAEHLNEIRDERDDEILANILPPRP
jgi:hypothetical protein